MRTQIDDEIAKLEAQIVQLRIRRNTLAPIARLPEVVLLQIMVEYQTQHRHSRSELGWRSIQWITITHVSHGLRALALEYPLLWITINPFIPVKWIGLFFSRTRPALLDVEIRFHHKQDYFDTLILLLSPEVHRVSSLVCHHPGVIGGKSWGPDYGINFSKAPLKYLELWDCRSLCQNWKPEFQLQFLKITTSAFNSTLLSQDLIELEVIRPDPETIPSKPIFLDMLSSLTNLRRLN